MSKHTPGPWRVDGEMRRRVIKNAKGSTVVVIEHWTTEADANLIAAAPEMLAALKRIAAHESRVDRSELVDIERIAHAAIAQAEAAGITTAQ